MMYKVSASRRGLSQWARLLSSTTIASFGLAMAMATPGFSQTINIGNNTDLTGYAAANGVTWQMMGNAFSNGIIALPTAMTIDGIGAGSSTIKMNDGSLAGLFSGGSASVNLANMVTFTGGTQTGNGSVFSTTGALTISGSQTFSGNKVDYTFASGSPGFTHLGGALYSGGAMVLGGAGSSLKFTNNSAGTFNWTNGSGGGAAYSAGTMTLTGSDITISNNKAFMYGGGLYAQDVITLNGSVTLSANTLSSTSSSGGAIYGAKDVIINGTTLVTGNGANKDGGAIWSGGNVKIATTGGDVTFTYNGSNGGIGGVIYAAGNVAIGNNAGVIKVTGNCGGLYQTGSGCNGSAGGGNGGAIWAGGTTNITGATVDFTSNRSNQKGGVIYSVGATTIDTPALTVGSNKATTWGGVVYGETDVTVTRSITATGNWSHNDGGVIYSGGNVKIATDGGNITFTGNQSDGGNGGGIMATGNVTIGNANAVIAMTQNLAGRNTDGSVGNYGFGGAIGSNGTVTITGASIDFSRNWATNNGGAIHAGNSIIINGSMSANDNNVSWNNGGALFTQTGGVQISGNLVMNNNYARQQDNASGGGIYSGNGVTIGGSLTANNNRTMLSGGGIYAATGDVAIHGAVSMSANIVSGGGYYTKNIGGGAISAITGNITLADTSGDISLTNNTSTGNGGGLFAKAGSSTIGNGSSDVKITGNTADAQGGGIFSATTTTINGTAVTLSNNKATGANSSASLFNGGGIYSGQTVTINGALTADNNTAKSYGGAIFVSSGAVRARNAASFDGNNAANSGGAIYAAGGNVILSDLNGNAALTNNIAGASGGAVLATSVTLGNSSGTVTITGNKAGFNGAGTQVSASASGGGLFTNAGAVTITGSDLQVSNNIATLNGGAVYSVGATTITGKAVNINDNTATNGNGGAVAAIGAFTLNISADTIVSGNSAGAKGGAIWAGGNATLNAVGGDLTFFGNKHGDPLANAMYLNNNGGATTTAFNAASGNIITFFDPVQSNAVNGLVSVNKIGAGMVSFDGSRYTDVLEQWSQVYGTTSVQAGTFEVANNAIYGNLSADVSRTATSSFTSDVGTMLQGGKIGTIRADAFTLNGDMSIAGRHAPVTDWSVFHVHSQNATFGNGKIFFNTYLNEGAPDNQQTDLLVLHLNGTTASGHAFLDVTNASGPGAWTENYNGIMLVQTIDGVTPGPADPLTAATNAATDTFTLSRRVAAGAYEYFLYRGGLDGDSQNANNWYLRNAYVAPPPPPPPPGCETTGDCPQPPPPVPPVTPTPRPEVPTNTVIVPLAIEYGYAMLDTLHERVGETWVSPLAPIYEERVVWCKDPAKNFKCVVKVPVAVAGAAGKTGKDEERWAKSGWARLIGNRGLHQPDNYGRRGPNYDYTFGGIQAGLDIYAREQTDGTLDKAGVYIGYGQISSDVRGMPGAYYGGKAGSVDMDAYTLGGYWSHHSPNGWYTDAVVQGTWYTNTSAKSVLNEGISPDGFGILGSLEAGYAFKLGNNWTLEPQAQVVYQNVRFNSASDSFGRFSFDDGDSLRGRLGVRVTKTWNLAEEARPPRLMTAWLRGNIWHEFLGKTKTTVTGFAGENPLMTPSYLGGTWGELGIGVSGQVSDTATLFATGAYQRSLDNKGSQGWDGRLGVTIKW